MNPLVESGNPPSENQTNKSAKKNNRNKNNKKKNKPQPVTHNGIDLASSESQSKTRKPFKPGKTKKNLSVSATTSISRPSPKVKEATDQSAAAHNPKKAGKRARREHRLQKLDQVRQGFEKEVLSGPSPVNSSSSESTSARELMMELKLSGEEDMSGEKILEEAEGKISSTSSSSSVYLKPGKVDLIIKQLESDIETENAPNHNAGSDHSDSDSENLSESEEAAAAMGGRYFGIGMGGGSSAKCFNCGEIGHIVKDCPLESSFPCTLCGELGHERSSCPAELCYNCSRPGHQSKACSARRKRRAFEDDYCNRCGQPCHLAKECTLAWRAYVFSRLLPHRIEDFQDELRGLRKHCYNCASISHFGDECPFRRRPLFSLFHLPDFDYLPQVIAKVSPPLKCHKSSEEGRLPKKVETVKPSHQPNQQKSKSKPGSLHQNENRKVFLSARGEDHSFDEENQEMFDGYTDSEEDEEEGKKRDEKYRKSRHSTGHGPHDQKQCKPNSVSFVRYVNSQVKVPRDPQDEDENGGFRKGSSAFKPSYRGGYRR